MCVYHHDDARHINLNSYYKKNGYEGLFDSFVNILSEKAKWKKFLEIVLYKRTV